MFKYVVLGSAACALMSVAAFGQHGGGEGRGMRGQPQTRVEVETRAKQHFAMLDANRDGVVTSEEQTAGRAAKMAERNDRHFAALDTNKDGSISRAEFDAGHSARDGMRGERGGGKRMHGGRGGHHGMDPSKRFGRVDANSDGKVTEAEMTAKALARFDRLDANKDGTLTAEERRSGWQAMRGSRGKSAGETDTF